jgi:hypothetical protein
MRTTLTIDDDLLDQARKRAAGSRRTLSQVVEDAMREAFARRAEATDPIELPVSRAGGGLRPGVSLDDRAALQDLLDEEVPIEQLR